MRKTKIVCTVGPASKERETLKNMLLAGMNVARLNFSHGTHEEHKQTIENFRKVRDELGIPAAVLLDTRGPEIRIKNFEKGQELLDDGQVFTITTRDVIGTKEIVSVTYKDFPQEVKAGNLVLINDGKIVIKVEETTETDVKGLVIHGGKISNHKGINLPNVNLNMEYMSEQDRRDILFGIENDVDYIAASFVRSANDVMTIRRLLDENGGEEIKVIAKIESTQGIENFEEILQVADGIMVARGDMGVEVAYEKLPGIQKRFIKRCVQSGKIVITATQMLESMITSQMPTRAEITDVANAVFDGTSAVMLSGETAAGQYPVEAVATMAKIARQAEEDMPRKEMVWHEMDVMDVTNAVGHAACTLAKDIQAGAIMAITKTGYTARRMSKFHPDIMVIGATPYEKTYHQLSLIWGVCPIIAGYRYDIEDLFSHCARKAIRAGLIKSGDKVVISAGLPVDVPGNTNIIRVVEAELKE
ncbi:pyruvate kinase [Emergencia sp.]|uniref:pyruvate kinase n=1 Tax=Emergencia sp. TaxID=1926557 RepID=UPI003AF16672